MKSDYKPKRLRTIFIENLAIIKEKILADGDFTYEDIDKFESEIKTFVRHTIHSVDELGLSSMDMKNSWIEDMD